MDRPTRDRRTAGRRRSIEWMGVFPVVLSNLGLGMGCSGVEEPVFEQIQRPFLGLAQSRARVDHLVENWLKPRRARDGTKDPAQCPLLLENVLELTGYLGVVGRHAGHASSLAIPSGLTCTGAVRQCVHHGQARHLWEA